MTSQSTDTAGPTTNSILQNAIGKFCYVQNCTNEKWVDLKKMEKYTLLLKLLLFLFIPV